MTDEPPGAESDAYQSFILQRELAEVYLLLDNLSGSPNRDLGKEKSDDDKPDIDLGGKDWIEAVCEIAWPPRPAGAPAPPGAPVAPNPAEAVRRLIRIRDYLNRRAAPANGLSIAFTSLVTGEGSDLKKMGEASNADDDDSSLWTAKKPMSRVDLAHRAFPNLWRSALWVRRWLHAAPYILIFWLLATCFLSWNVATGTALLGQLSTTQADKTAVESQITDAQNGNGGSAGGNGNSGTGVQPAAANTPSTPGQTPAPPLSNKAVIAYCMDVPQTAAGTAPPAAKLYNSVTQLRLCGALTEKTSDLDAAVINLGNWSRGWQWLTWLDQPEAKCSALDGTDCPQAETQQWASSLLGVLSGSVLPVFYGLLGAGAAVVRNLSAKVRDWQLAPRDLQMSLIQLALGAVIGACIGLFVTPPGAAGGAAAQAGSAAASAEGLLGPVHLSASALCFIAGFFVEGVFGALESLMRRVFNIGDQPPKPSR